jgi:hypothetical protein
MGSIGWSIFRTTLGASLLILLSLTAIGRIATSPGLGPMAISLAAIIAPPSFMVKVVATAGLTRRFATT